MIRPFPKLIATALLVGSAGFVVASPSMAAPRAGYGVHVPEERLDASGARALRPNFEPGSAYYPYRDPAAAYYRNLDEETPHGDTH